MEERTARHAPGRKAAPSPEAIARLAVDDLLSRDEYMRYDVGDVHAIHYAEACAAYGAARFAGLPGDNAALEALAARYAKERLPPNTANHVDANVFGILPLELSMRLEPDSARSRALGEEGLSFADGQWAGARDDELSPQTRFWIDDMYMIASLQCQAYRATGKAVYLARAALELDAYAKRLQRPEGLFFHGPEAPHFWGRGNGWVAAALAELLSVLPDADQRKADLVRAFRRMMDALLAHQAEDGMWRQLVDHPEAWKETSATAMFGYAMAGGTRSGVLPVDLFRPACERAWEALSRYVDERGRLDEVCAGTGQKDDVSFYLERPRVKGDLHGQAALLWFASELIRT